MAPSGPVDPSGPDLRDLALTAARDAGQLLLDALFTERTVDTKSSPTAMVTEMDRAAEARLVDLRRLARPDDGILGEEGAAVDGSSGLRWVIDPLDGTTNYLYRLPGWNVAVGVERAGIAVAGAVVSPATGDAFAGAIGSGSSWNDHPLDAGRRPVATSLRSTLAGTGFNYAEHVRAEQGAQLTALVPRVRDIRRFGAAAFDLCNVAAGRLDAYFETGLAPWDRCAGTAIARAAGIHVLHTDDHPLPGRLTLAAHPDRWDEWWDALVELGIVEADARPCADP